MEFKIDVDISNLVNGLEETKRKVKQAMFKTLQDSARDIVQNSKADCPVDTGTLRDSINIMSQGENFVVVGSPVHYAGFVNFGTRFMSAQPFLSDNVEVATDNFANKFISNLE